MSQTKKTDSQTKKTDKPSKLVPRPDMTRAKDGYSGTEAAKLAARVWDAKYGRRPRNPAAYRAEVLEG